MTKEFEKTRPSGKMKDKKGHQAEKGRLNKKKRTRQKRQEETE